MFVHVRDIEQAISWYSDLLGVPRGDTSHAGLIYDLPTGGSPGLVLDGHAAARGAPHPPAGPGLMLEASDIDAAHSWAASRAEVGAIENIGSVSTFHLADPDGNRLIVFAPNDGA
jgi:catechol 2,3-dioxygenase-like lactoylglutathione lyase family enzyme